MRTTTAMVFLLLATPAFVQADPLAITAKEKSACGYDAARFCAATYPDEPGMRPVVDADLKRRGLEPAASAVVRQRRRMYLRIGRPCVESSAYASLCTLRVHRICAAGARWKRFEHDEVP